MTNEQVDPGELASITPNHFPIGGPNTTTTPDMANHESTSVRQQWRLCRELSRRFYMIKRAVAVSFTVGKDGIFEKCYYQYYLYYSITILECSWMIAPELNRNVFSFGHLGCRAACKFPGF